jgi:hypothetical protein
VPNVKLHCTCVAVMLCDAATVYSESVGNDIRQVLHAMEMWSRRSSTMKYKEVHTTVCQPYKLYVI